MKKHTFTMAAFSASQHELTFAIKDEDIDAGSDDWLVVNSTHCDSK